MTGTERRVVFVSQMYPPDKGGNAARIHDVATNLTDEEWEVSVLAPPPCYPPGEFDRSWRRIRTKTVDEVTVHRLWSWQPRSEDPGTVPRLAYYFLFGIHAALWMLLNGRRYDAVVTTTPPISTGGPGLVASALGASWVVDVRDLWIDASISLGYLEAGSALERVSRRFQRHVLQTADRIAVTTQTLGDSIQHTYGQQLAEKTILVPNGVDVERFRPHAELGSGRNGASSDHPEAEREPETSGGDDGDGDPDDEEPAIDEHTAKAVGEADVITDGGGPTIIYAGNLGTAQDLESCLRAMTHLSHEDASLQLVGRGDVESNLRRLADELGLRDRVDFVGIVPRDAVPALLAAATIGIAPLQDTSELAYAMPTKVYEYMACGLPTVVTGRGEIERFVAESGGGVHAANDPERIAERMAELLANERLRERMSERGRQHVEAGYDRGTIARDLGAELDRLVAAEDGR